MDLHGGYKPVGLSQWTGGAIGANIVLDQPGNTAYTNLDRLSGRVIVRATKSVDISSITVKLEGESTTRLMSPGGGPANDRPRPQLEYHKILYKTQTIFPPPDILEGRSVSTLKAAYTLPPGQHSYPFSFKIPFNNTCYNETPGDSQMSILPGSFEIARPAPNHVRQTLPPTLTGFPGEAEIRYFVKVTVGRQSFFKENPRAYVPFTFFPIESPRKPLTGSEVFARQRHSFTANASDATPKKGLFNRKPVGPASPTTTDGLQISIDARLPEPAILTCNSRLPLRLVLKRLSNLGGAIYLDSLQIALIGHTRVRAHEVFRTESNSWVVVSQSNLNMLVSTEADEIGAEIVVDDHLWADRPLPKTVAPSFQTCNISRDYQLDVRIGIKYQIDHEKASKATQKSTTQLQSVILPLRLATLVYSGIAPPPELLSRMAEGKVPPPADGKDHIAVDDLKHAPQVATPLVADQSGLQSNTVPLTEADESTTLAPSGVAGLPEYSEAPPSYEDAIANDINPVTASRPEYAPPPAADDDILHKNEKRRTSTP